MTDIEIEQAKRAAYSAATKVYLQHGVPHRDDRDRVMSSAERAVMRRMLARLLPGGEVEYWRLIEEEVRR